MNEHDNPYTEDAPEQVNAGESGSQGKSESFTPPEENEYAEMGEAMDPEQLQDKLAELEQEKDEMNKRLLRLQADFDNYRKRSRAEKDEMVDYATFDLVRRLLPVIDNLERACAAAEESPEGLVGGVSMVTRQLKELLEREGLQTIDCKGKPFDPQCHEAVLTEESGEHSPNTVVGELQRGYRMKDRVLRPSMVKVAVDDEKS